MTLLNKIWWGLKIALMSSATFCLLTLGIYILQLNRQTKQIGLQTQQSLAQIVKDVDSLTVMTNATLYQIGDVSHSAADMIRLEQGFVKQESKQLLESSTKLNTSLDQLNLTLVDLDQQSKISLAPLPSLLDQVTETTKQAQDTLKQSHDTIATLQTTINNLNPMIANLSGTTEHINNISASLDTVVRNATKPRPWYKKLPGDAWIAFKAFLDFYK